MVASVTARTSSESPVGGETTYPPASGCWQQMTNKEFSPETKALFEAADRAVESAHRLVADRARLLLDARCFLAERERERAARRSVLPNALYR